MTGEEVAPREGVAAQPGDWILVIGSYASLQNLLQYVLSMAGYAARGCATLGEAELLLRRFALPRLILLDVASATEEALPHHLRQLYTLLPHEQDLCPILVLSAMHPLPRPHMLPGRVRVVAKPFHLAHLMSVVADQMAPPHA
jgi:DNA-binding response OmpR family regulator